MNNMQKFYKHSIYLCSVIHGNKFYTHSCGHCSYCKLQIITSYKVKNNKIGIIFLLNQKLSLPISSENKIKIRYAMTSSHNCQHPELCYQNQILKILTPKKTSHHMQISATIIASLQSLALITFFHWTFYTQSLVPILLWDPQPWECMFSIHQNQYSIITTCDLRVSRWWGKSYGFWCCIHS
jgi:hypothetical protein